MKKTYIHREFTVILVLALILSITTNGQSIRTNILLEGQKKIFVLANDFVTCKIVLVSNKLKSDTLSGSPAWLKSYNCNPVALATDAGFGLKFVWTDWQAPHTLGNAENPVTLSNDDFILSDGDFHDPGENSKDLVLNFKAVESPYNPILVRVTYHLDADAFFIKRKIEVSDTSFGHHFLDVIESRSGNVQGISSNSIIKTEILKKGGFGQPVALTFGNAGAFFGLEYPAATNTAEIIVNSSIRINCSQEFGMKAGKEVIGSEWVVEGLVPGNDVKEWFFKYLDKVKVAQAKPYVLYNSWYDLRSPEYPQVEPDHVMNEKNVLNIINLFKKNMINKHHISLDAFVLDDGWDVYESDWVLRKETFPDGLKPVTDTLKKIGTGLGIWFGPTGGYSFRMKRVNWMDSHGYETVGVTRDNKMLCLAGKNYSDLFRKRATDLVSHDGISYFKWDGIQFSCSEEGHGHPVGIYSRRAVMESVIDMCNAVRKINPDIFLNITSGTWLSPWWLKYANTIWMQGEDYGYANIPGINQRDAAMTYKDLVLYNQLRENDFWFPVSGLMTHGIIKGNLERLGGEDDPLDKFTNDVVFYVARGVSMYELYISPDLLNDDEWDAIGKAISWAKDRFEILSSTFMAGGSVPEGKAYGYVHFKGNRGIIAARNPVIGATALKIQLSADMGLDAGKEDLVIEKTYPEHQFLPGRFTAGMSVDLPLEGFETAVYEIVPASEAKDRLAAMKNPSPLPPVLKGKQVTKTEKQSDRTIIRQRIMPDPSVTEVRYAILLRPDKGSEDKDFPVMTVNVKGKKEIRPTMEAEKGQWAWFSFVTVPVAQKVELVATSTEKSKGWKGNGELYVICKQKTGNQETGIKDPRPSLPLPYGEGMRVKTISLGKTSIETP